MMRHLIHALTRTPTQAEPLSSATPQVRNDAGGYVWSVDGWTRLDRFLVLGSSEGSYYATPTELTLESARAVTDLLEIDGVKVVERIVEIRSSGRAPKATPAIFALAVAMKHGDLATRRAAHQAVGTVCRTGTHLFELASAISALGGWGRGTQRAFADWYTNRGHAEAAFQMMKYQRRQGWSHRDILRKAHARPPDEGFSALFRWVTQGYDAASDALTGVDGAGRIAAFERLKVAESVDEVVDLVQAWRLPRETIPSRWLNKPDVWRALLYGGGKSMPMTALLRNLATMTRLGVVAPMAAETRFIAERLADPAALRAARVHPLAVLVALQTYQSGRGIRGSQRWTPVPQIVDALDAAFYAAFDHQESTGKRWMLSLDVSGSMGWTSISGLPGITPRVASAAMAMVTARVEEKFVSMAFSNTLRRLAITPRQRLDDVLKVVSSLPFGSTDCALPMRHAMKERIPVDAFVVYTDSETWSGDVHPARALRDYRQAMGIDAKLIVVAMVGNRFTIADPNDAGMLDVVGFDLATPGVMNDFVMAR